jgi:hypothetical protein
MEILVGLLVGVLTILHVKSREAHRRDIEQALIRLCANSRREFDEHRNEQGLLRHRGARENSVAVVTAERLGVSFRH